MSMTVEDLKNAVITFVNIAEEEVVSNEFEELDNNGVEILNELSELEQYRAIGTVSEFRELKEKATAKKPLHQGFVYVCPCCNDKVTIGSTLLRINQKYCTECGTEFDWSEGKGKTE